MWGFQRTSGAILWWFLVVYRWFQSQFTEPFVSWWLDAVLGTWEESLKAILREGFATLTRLINGVSAWVVSLFFKQGYYETMRTRNRKLNAWQAWWEERAQSTFSAVLERDGLLVGSPKSSALAGKSQMNQKGWSSAKRQKRRQAPRQPVNFISNQGKSCSSAPRRRWYHLWFQASPNAAAADADSAYQKSPTENQGDEASCTPKMRRSGSELFERPSGYGIAEGLPRRGLLEDTRLGLELAVTAVFEAVRTAIRAILLLPQRQAAASSQEAWIPHRAFRELALSSKAHRPSATSRFEDLNVWTAADVILQAGYPLEEHIVTTSTGYILQMHRIPRKGARDVVFFMHGILDTSLGWVSNGVLGSQAFAAWDSGQDVWLGNSRSNPPRAHVSPNKQGAFYWRYTLNELGSEDIAAQVDHIHMVKCGELQSGWVWRHTTVEDPSVLKEPSARLRRTVSDTALAERRRVELAAAHIKGDGPSHQQAAVNMPELSKQQGRVSLDGSSGQPARHRYSIKTPPHHQDLVEEEPLSTSRSTESHSNKFRSYSLLPFKRMEAFARKGGAQKEVAGLQTPAMEPIQPSLSSSSSSSAAAAAAGQHLQHQKPTPSRPPCLQHPGGSPVGVSRDGTPPPPDVTLLLPVGTSSQSQAMHASTPTTSCSSSAASSVEDQFEQDSALSHVPQESPTTSSRGNERVEASSTDAQHMKTPARALKVRLNALNAASREQPTGLQPTRRERLPTDAAQARAVTAPPESPRQQHPRGVPRYTWMQRGQQRSLSEPYRLRAVGHSLGAASLLIYAVVSRMKGQPHRFRRMVLLTPAGFHVKHPKVLIPFIIVVPWLVRFLNWVRPGIGSPAYLPSSLVRYIAFKLSLDMDHIPALNELTRAGISLMLSGDSSQWDRALQMPHYNTYSMPAVSFHTGDHFMQLMRTGRFQLYDYGSPEGNMQHYGTSTPPDIAQNYHLLRDLPIDLVAGRQDGIIPPEDVLLHHQAMERAGIQVSYKDFDVGHLDVTFAVKDDIRHYVLSRLQPRKWLHWRNNA